MDEAEYQLWASGNERLLLMFRATTPCRDCTPLFHADMVDGGLCDGVPGDVGATLPTPEEMGRMGYAALRALRDRFPHNGPADLSVALYRARQRERERERRRRVPA